tara:strand:+ start:4882 stop:5814 length:933 start_codon:yes stop_codon:yes gene_type:complete
MELRQIKYFVAVAECGSLSGAVDNLHIAQPALSYSIRTLEKELGAKLFVRSRQGMQLTSSGSAFLEYAHVMLRHAAQAKDVVRDAEDNPRGPVSIAMPPSVSNALAGELHTRLTSEYPGIALNLDESLTSDLRQAFDSGLYDILIFFAVGQLENIHVEPLISEELYFVTGIENMPDAPAEMAFEQLQNYEITLPRMQHGVERAISRIAMANGFKLNLSANTIGIYTLMNLVRRGTANTVVPWTLIGDDVDQHIVAAAKIVDPCINRVINLVTPTNRPQSNACKVVIGLIRDIVRDLHSDGTWRGELLVES